MEVQNYHIDTRLLAYWIVGILGLGLAVFAGHSLLSDEPETVETGGLELQIEEDLVRGELADLYVYQNAEPVEGATVIIDNEMEGQTDSTGYQVLSIPDENFELEVRYEEVIETETVRPITEEEKEEETGDEETEDEADEEEIDEETDEEEADDETDEEETDEGELVTGIELDETPEAGEENRLTAKEDGERLDWETVQFNGEEQGQTSPGGTMTFTVPNTETLQIIVGPVQEEFDVEEYEQETDEEDDAETVTGDVDADFEVEGLRYVGETITLDATNTDSKNEIDSFNWDMEHEDETIEEEGEKVDFEPSYEGRYNFTLEITDVEDFAETTENFAVIDEEYEEPEITLSRPNDGEEVEAEHDFEFAVDNARSGQSAIIEVGGEEEISRALDDGLNSFDGLTMPITQEGELEYFVKVEDETGSWESTTRTIENTRAFGEFGNFNLELPEEGDSFSTGEIDFELDIEPEAQVEIQVDLADEETFTNSEIFDQEGLKTVQVEVEETGEYDAEITVSPTDTSETKNIDAEIQVD